MNKTEMLFVRACKSKDPIKRLKTLHKRIYIYSSEKETQKNIVHVLSKLCMEYSLIDIVKFIHNINETSDRYYFFENQVPIFNTACLDVLVSAIRFAKASELPDLIPPARFKN